MRPTIPFPCTSCGCCCRRVRNAVEAVGSPEVGHPLHFPYTWDETGRCEHLQPNHRCAVYESRPLLCRVDDLADQLAHAIPREQFILENIAVCNHMMDEDGIPEEYRIKTDKP